MVIDLDQTTSPGAQDELAVTPGCAGDHLCWSGVVLQDDGLTLLVHSHLHCQVEQLGVSVCHSEPGEQPHDNLLGGGLGEDPHCLIHHMRTQACGVNSDSVGRRNRVDDISIFNYILRIVFFLVLSLPCIMWLIKIFVGRQLSGRQQVGTYETGRFKTGG